MHQLRGATPDVLDGTFLERLEVAQRQHVLLLTGEQARRIHAQEHRIFLHLRTCGVDVQLLDPAFDLRVQSRDALFVEINPPDSANRVAQLGTDRRGGADADVVNNDPIARDRLKIVFFPDYNVKNAQHVYPAADLSEQISTAGMEASGTGNMKFAMNGALTIGTLDGANIEIREEVGEENFFLFGATAAEIRRLKADGYHPEMCCQHDAELQQVIDLVRSGVFSKGDTELFRPLLDSLLKYDEYMLLHDYRSYIECQEEVGRRYCDRDAWVRSSILNTARMGKFSSDRAIKQYCKEVWKVKPVRVKAGPRVGGCGQSKSG